LHVDINAKTKKCPSHGKATPTQNNKKTIKKIKNNDSSKEMSP
jgi:hypothetical protein